MPQNPELRRPIEIAISALSLCPSDKDFKIELADPTAILHITDLKVDGPIHGIAVRHADGGEIRFHVSRLRSWEPAEPLPRRLNAQARARHPVA